MRGTTQRMHSLIYLKTWLKDCLLFRQADQLILFNFYGAVIMMGLKFVSNMIHKRPAPYHLSKWELFITAGKPWPIILVLWPRRFMNRILALSVPPNWPIHSINFLPIRAYRIRVQKSCQIWLKWLVHIQNFDIHDMTKCLTMQWRNWLLD